MANKPLLNPLPADLPENWQINQIVAPTGAEVGLAEQYGYNYLMAQLNAAQQAINNINEAFPGLAGLVDGKVPLEQLPVVTPDDALSDTSKNPVQNKVITAALNDKVPITRKVNGKALNGDITLGFNDFSGILPISKGGTDNDTGLVTSGQKNNTTLGYRATAEGIDTTSSARGSHAEGRYSIASSDSSHVEGYQTVASGDSSHAEGSLSVASGENAHAEGKQTTAIGDASHAEGFKSVAKAGFSHAEGDSTAEGPRSHAEGSETVASKESCHSEGYSTIASNFASHVGGKFNKLMTTGGTSSNKVGDVFVIGNGSGSTNKSNAFRVTYAGAVYGLSAFNTSGADYAEYFEWQDTNPEAEDRVGFFVTLQGDKICLAQAGDYLLGIVSANPCIIGNADEDWLGRWEHDDFGRFIQIDVERQLPSCGIRKYHCLMKMANPPVKYALKSKKCLPARLFTVGIISKTRIMTAASNTLSARTGRNGPPLVCWVCWLCGMTVAVRWTASASVQIAALPPRRKNISPAILIG